MGAMSRGKLIMGTLGIMTADVPPSYIVEHTAVRVKDVTDCPVCFRPRWYDGTASRCTHCESGTYVSPKPGVIVIEHNIFCPRCPGTVRWIVGAQWECRICKEWCLDAGLRRAGVNAPSY